ncbi:MAG: methionine synthase, partial [Actinomycetota bacterium]
TLDDYREQEGNSEVLNFSRPDIIQGIHESFLKVGCDVIETNTFGANNAAQGEYGQADKVYELNVIAARMAREVAAGFTDRPRWVAGSMGPGTKSPINGQITFDELEESYNLQTRGLMEGGVDLLIIETCFDILQAKSAVAAAMRAFDETGIKLPLIVQVTIETMGTMLWGTEIGAALTTLDPFGAIDVLGINCATGPVEMTEPVRFLTRHSRKPVSVQPNAGLPVMQDGKPVFPLSPEEFVRYHEIFVKEFGVSIIGGCCGTTPEHLRQLVDALQDHPAPKREVQFEPSCASLYISQPFTQDTSFFVVGERCNTNGSRKFKDLVEAEDDEGCLALAKEQVREGAHALDVCVDFVGRDGVVDMTRLISRFRDQVTLPIFIDSTEWEVVEAALKLIGGRPVINSISLEDGVGENTSLMHKFAAARKFGAAMIALAIDETGQAETAELKFQVCKRTLELALEHGFEPHDLIFDTLALPVSTGMEAQRRAGIETLDAIERIKSDLPDCFTSLGVSNVSFGLNPAARQVLNSVFLDEAVKRGLDVAIVAPAKILPLSRIDDQARETALDVVYDRRRDGYDPLQSLIALFENVRASGSASQADLLAELNLEERLQRRIIDGIRIGLETDLEEALTKSSALDIINLYLLEGMKVVGELFASNQMQLPFVLQSAETMKQAVAFLEPHMDRTADVGKGKIVLATVKGDVHDIGKNLVDIILTNNGYTVFNIGIKQPITSIIETAEREGCDAIGLSGLLFKSTLVMKDDLNELNTRGLSHYPVILGGAALNRAYVEDDLRSIYKGSVFYGRDAFEGLRTMEELMTAKREGTTVESAVKPKRQRNVERDAVVVPLRSNVAADAAVPVPPFWGSRVVTGIAQQEVAAYLNKEVALFRGQWQYKRKKGQTIDEYRHYLDAEVEPILREWLARSLEEQILTPAVVYGYFHAQSEGDDLIVYRDDAKTEWARFAFPRQQSGRFLCLADFFRSVESGEMDVVAFHLVTVGRRTSEVAQTLFKEDHYTDYLHLHGLSVEMAEALAELWHERIRQELGFGSEDGSGLKSLFRQKYRGSRYSFGYPACPNLEDQVKIMELLEPQRIDVTITEEFQLDPEQSTSAIIVHHPEAKYFSIAR